MIEVPTVGSGLLSGRPPEDRLDPSIVYEISKGRREKEEPIRTTVIQIPGR